MAMNVVKRIGRTDRKTRTPLHPFNIYAKPHVLQVNMCAPVLPGETMTSLLWQARAQTEQLRHGLTGWWYHQWFFYVKLSQLDDAEEWIAPPTNGSGGGMLMNVEYDATGLADAAEAASYHEDTAGINYPRRCRDVIVRECFRDADEDETTADGLLDSLPMMHAKRPGWWRSIQLTSVLAALSPELPDDAANATIRELERLQQQWEMLNAMGNIDMTYEDFLATFGVRGADPNGKRPELLRHEKFWQLPATAVDGATGVTSSVVSWKCEGRADKNRAFQEHGFIVGICTVEPKVYERHQSTAGVTMLDSAFAWAPAMFDANFAGITIRDYADGRGPYSGGVTEGYTLDTKDLFLYGDQFVNRLPSDAGVMNTATIAGGVPTSRYTSSAIIDEYFIAANTTNAYESDGRVQLNILSALRDTSPDRMSGIVLPAL